MAVQTILKGILYWLANITLLKHLVDNRMRGGVGSGEEHELIMVQLVK
jgi:hypothetical protein